MVLEPLDRVDVEMVRRLVEEQQIRIRDERFPEQRSPPPSAGQLLHRPVGRQRQPRQDDLDLAARAATRRAPRAGAAARPGVRSSATASSVSATRIAARWYSATSAPSAPSPSATSSKTTRSPAPGTSCSSRGDPQSRRAPHGARVRKSFSRDDLQQARLPRAVPADQRDALAGLHAKIGRLEKRQMAVSQGHGIEGQKRHWE